MLILKTERGHSESAEGDQCGEVCPGIDQTLIDKVPGYKHSSSFDEKQQLVLRWTDAITFLSDDIVNIKNELEKHFSQKELVDLTASISLMNALNRLRITLRDKY